MNYIRQGDSRELLNELADNSVDFIFTDPPYGHNNNNGDMASRREAIFEGKKNSYDESTEWRPIANDGKEANDLFRDCIREYARILKPGCCCCCCCCGGGRDPQWARWSLWLDEVLDFKHMIIWDKGPMGMGNHYRRSYETVLVAQKKGASCKWYDTSKRIENVIRPGMYGIKKIIPQADQHPTEKPPQLAGLFIKLHTNPGDLVLDPFAGAGSTLVAAKTMDRRYLGFELDQRWIVMAERKLNAAQCQLV